MSINIATPSKLNEDLLRQAKCRLLKMHYEAGVGHIGGNLSVLDSLTLIFIEYLIDEAKVVLSKGHGAGALYIALWTVGVLSDDDLNTFHCDGTKLPGHPPSFGYQNIPFATGSLGHGLSLASGLALGKKFSNKSDRVFCITSDGEWQEGSTWEALIFASHNKLNNMTVLIDKNGLQGFGSTGQVASMNKLEDRLSSFDIDVVCVNGHDLHAIRNALNKKQNRLTIIILETVKGKGISFMENKMEWHYLPLTQADYKQAIQELSVF
jgi:transketolase